MTSKQALKQAVKRWGKTGCVRDEKRCASTPEARAEAKAALQALPPSKERTPEQRSEASRLAGLSWMYRYSVGHVAIGMFFAVKGEGDTWEEAFYAADYSAAKDHDDFLNRRKAA